MCDWHLNPTQPRPANYDGCLPLRVTRATNRKSSTYLVPSLALAIGAAWGIPTLALTDSAPRVGALVLGASLLVAFVAVIGVGVGVLVNVDRATGEVKLSASNVHLLACDTLATFARVNGFDPTPAVIHSLLPARSTFTRMAPSEARALAQRLTVDVVNLQAARVGDPLRITPADVRELVRVGA
jgi:hypothetical protein